MITFKNIEAKDEAFNEQVYRSTREKELDLTGWIETQKQAFIKMQSFAQLADYKKNYIGATYEFILYKKKPVGRLFLYETENEIKVIDIALLPNFQGKGIGTKILTGIIDSAKQKKKMVTLDVIKDNPAKRLYESLGFKKTNSDNLRDYMEWRNG